MSDATVTCARCHVRSATISDRLCKGCRQDKDRARSSLAPAPTVAAQQPPQATLEPESPSAPIREAETIAQPVPAKKKRGPRPSDSRQARYRRAHPERTAQDLTALRRKPHKRVTLSETSDANE